MGIIRILFIGIIRIHTTTDLTGTRALLSSAASTVKSRFRYGLNSYVPNLWSRFRLLPCWLPRRVYRHLPLYQPMPKCLRHVTGARLNTGEKVCLSMWPHIQRATTRRHRPFVGTQSYCDAGGILGRGSTIDTGCCCIKPYGYIDGAG